MELSHLHKQLKDNSKLFLKKESYLLLLLFLINYLSQFYHKKANLKLDFNLKITEIITQTNKIKTKILF